MSSIPGPSKHHDANEGDKDDGGPDVEIDCEDVSAPESTDAMVVKKVMIETMKNSPALFLMTAVTMILTVVLMQLLWLVVDTRDHDNEGDADSNDDDDDGDRDDGADAGTDDRAAVAVAVVTVVTAAAAAAAAAVVENTLQVHV